MARTIEEIWTVLLPPMERGFREGFANQEYLDSLVMNERQALLQEIRHSLKTERALDPWILEIVAHLRATAILPDLRTRYSSISEPIEKLHIARTAYQISPADHSWVKEATRAVDQISNRYLLPIALIHLSYVDHIEVTHKLQSYLSHADYVIARAAQDALALQQHRLRKKN